MCRAACCTHAGHVSQWSDATGASPSVPCCDGLRTFLEPVTGLATCGTSHPVCRPPAFLRFTADVSQSGYEGNLELRFVSTTDATITSTGAACSGWSSTSLTVTNGGRVEIPRASPFCNTWGASSQCAGRCLNRKQTAATCAASTYQQYAMRHDGRWAIYEPELRVNDKLYGVLSVQQDADHLVTRVDYTPSDSLFCLGNFAWTIDESSNEVTIRGAREAPCGCPSRLIPGVDPVNPNCFIPADYNYDIATRSPREFKLSRSTWRSDTGCDTRSEVDPASHT
jgi:hypothetical protein